MDEAITVKSKVVPGRLKGPRTTGTDDGET